MIGAMKKLKTVTRMYGKMSNKDFIQLFEKQIVNQKYMLDTGKYDGFKKSETKEVPCDDVRLMSYHVQQLVSEIGEVLEADKRWKNFRNAKFEKEAKAEEIADCFIVLMNIAMFSGLSAEELYDTVDKKLDIVYNRITK